MLSNPASFYISLMFALSFLLVTPSILLLRRMAQATITEKPLPRLILGILSGVLALVVILTVDFPVALYAAGGLVVVAVAFSLPWIRDLSFLSFLQRGYEAEVVGPATGSRPVGRAPRSRKPRTVWSNPIAWREAKTKASAARASLLRYSFIAAGLVAAIALVYRFAQVERPALTVIPANYDPDTRQLTIGRDTYQVPPFDNAPEYPIKLTEPDPSTPGQTIDKPFDVSTLRGTLEVVGEPGVSPVEGGGLGRRTRTITSLTLRPVPRLLEAGDARRYLLGVTVIEFAIILLIVTNAAASTVTREKEDGTLDLLLSSPITSRYYIWGKLRGLVSFVLPLVAVPVASVLLFVIYDLTRLVGSGNDPDFRWIVFPEAVVLLPGMLIIVCAFAAILGMQMSLRCRTTVMAVMSSVGIIVVICAALGFCGFSLLKPDAGSGSNASFQVAVGTFSPFTLMQLLINPYSTVAFKLNNVEDADGNRLVIAVCTVIAVAGYTAIVWSMYQSMVKNFDMTIRKQSR